MSFWTLGWENNFTKGKNAVLLKSNRTEQKSTKNDYSIVRYAVQQVINGISWHRLHYVLRIHSLNSCIFAVSSNYVYYIASIQPFKSKLSCLLKIFTMRNSLNNVMFSIFIIIHYFLSSLFHAVCMCFNISSRIIHSLCSGSDHYSVYHMAVALRLTETMAKNLSNTISNFILCE